MSDERNINLMGYLPPYYHENKEMISVTESENPEVSQLWDIIAAEKRNQFILDSDETKIMQWEKLLRIRPDYAIQSLEYRKAVVIMRLSTRLPLVYRWLKEKLTDIVGEKNFLINLYFDRYLLYIRITNDRLGLIGELRQYLREKLPANLGIDIEEMFKLWSEVLEKYYLFWGCVPVLHTWEDRLPSNWGGYLNTVIWQDYTSGTWGAAISVRWGEGIKTWHTFADKAETGGVISTECWWTRNRLTWVQANKMTWQGFFRPNTWQDVKNYVWEDETA